MGRDPGGRARGEGSQGLDHTWAGLWEGLASRSVMSQVSSSQCSPLLGQQSKGVSWEPVAAGGFSWLLGLGCCSSVLLEWVRTKEVQAGHG